MSKELNSVEEVLEHIYIAGWNDGKYGKNPLLIANYHPDKSEALAAINRVRVQDKVEALQRVKEMGIYDTSRPDDHFVWSWKIDREIAELQQQLKELA